MLRKKQKYIYLVKRNYTIVVILIKISILQRNIYYFK